MEKIIFLGVAVWLSFVLIDGFPPKPVRKPHNHSIEISKPNPGIPDKLKSQWYRTNYD